MFVYRLNEAVTLEDCSYYSKGDIVSHKTMDRIMAEYYEVSVTIIRVL